MQSASADCLVDATGLRVEYPSVLPGSVALNECASIDRKPLP